MDLSIDVFSDIHFEHHGAPYSIKGHASSPIVVNAGDTHPDPGFRTLLKQVISEKYTYVEALGNHDFYGGSFPQPGENQSLVEVEGIKIASATLWTKLSPIEWFHYVEVIADSKHISGLTHQAYLAAHESDLAFLLSSGADVFVTHHSPSDLGQAPWRPKGDAMSPCFHNRLEETLLSMTNPPRLWIHGHTHDRCDYVIGKTRVYSNPRGYGQENPDFKLETIRV